jgi:hypothetical protein
LQQGIAHSAQGLERILPTNTDAAAQETIKKTMNVMVDEIEAVSTDIAKLQLSGRGFETYKIKGVDKNVRNCFSQYEHNANVV